MFRLVYHGFKNFSYVFIDEAGQATETDSLIPFSINDDAHIILAGDHLQLGPVVKSKLAESILGKTKNHFAKASFIKPSILFFIY